MPAHKTPRFSPAEIATLREHYPAGGVEAVPAPAAPGRLLKMKDVVHETSLHRATIYRMIRAGEFPRGTLITRARVVWTERDVEAWKQQRLFAPSP